MNLATNPATSETFARFELNTLAQVDTLLDQAARAQRDRRWSIIRARDEDVVIAIANGTAFRHGAAIWTADADRSLAVARRIEAGAMLANAIVASDAHVPFGGINRSGNGREVRKLGLKEFTNSKTIRCACPAPEQAA